MTVLSKVVGYWRVTTIADRCAVAVHSGAQRTPVSPTYAALHASQVIRYITEVDSLADPMKTLRMTYTLKPYRGRFPQGGLLVSVGV